MQHKLWTEEQILQREKNTRRCDTLKSHQDILKTINSIHWCNVHERTRQNQDITLTLSHTTKYEITTKNNLNDLLTHS